MKLPQTFYDPPPQGGAKCTDGRCLSVSRLTPSQEPKGIGSQKLAGRPWQDWPVTPFRGWNNNNNNNNYHDSAVIMTEVTAKVHSVNVEQRQTAADPQTKPSDLGCESTCFRQLSSTTTIAIYYYYSARKLILIYHSMECRRLSWPRHCRKGAHSPCPRL